MNVSDRAILAFCHIEKAAGTSLIHVLRQVFSTGYVDARPLTKGHGSFLGHADFELFNKLIPGIRCIGGHAVVPHSDLTDVQTRFHFITLLRDPVSRVVSHYKFWVQRMGSRFGPEDFLKHPVASNFQVRKIAGANDVAKAMDVIRKHFMLIGTIEEFDKFLVLLSGHIHMPANKMIYQPRNIADDNQALHLPEKFRERVEEINDLDHELYSWVKNELVPQYIRQYGASFRDDVASFRRMLKEQNVRRARSFAGNIIRNGYVKPVTGVIRVWNGMPYSGSYTN